MDDAIPVRVPQETVNDEKVRLVCWRAEEGSRVSAGDIVADIETSKSVFEIAAGAQGCLRRVAQEGDWVPVGDVLCWLTPKADSPLPSIESQKSSAPQGGPAISRKARILIDSEGIDPSVFAGSDMVRESDVRKFLEKGPKAAAKGVASKRHELSDRKRAEAAALLGGGTNVLRSLVAIQVSDAAYKAAVEKCVAFSSVPSGLILFEAARVLSEMPLFNSHFSNGGASVPDSVNIGFVVDGDHGLRVPVVNGVDQKDEGAVAAEIQDLLLAYHEQELTTTQESGGTFTITDLSAEGVTRFEPLINASQSAILGVAAAVDGRFELCLSFDHRLHEGRSAARFLKAVAARIEARA